jgi:DNA polymerase-1
MPTSEALALLRPLLTDPSIEKFGHDLKADLIVLGRHGVDVQNPKGFDTMIASYLVDANRSSQALEPIALEQLGYKAVTEDEVRGKGVKAIAFAQVPVDSVLDYAANAPTSRCSCRAPAADPHQRRARAVYRDLELPLVPILAAIERRRASTCARSPRRRSCSIARRSAARCSPWPEANSTSAPKQLAEILFEKLQLPVLKRTGTSRAPSAVKSSKSSRSTDICRFILDWRQLSK